MDRQQKTSGLELDAVTSAVTCVVSILRVVETLLIRYAACDWTCHRLEGFETTPG